MPGGHLNFGEEPLDGAIRELREETGLDAQEFPMEFLGDDTTARGVHVYSFAVTIPLGAPHAYNDPDGEAAEFRWMSPEEIPSDDQLHTPRAGNVTLQLMGIGGQPMAKADYIGPEWHGQDGLRIPHHSSPNRPEWDRQHKSRVAHVFAGGDVHALEETNVPTNLASHWSEHANGRDRRRLYARMLSGGDRLPPIVIDHTGNVLDGKTRLWVAKQHGLQSIGALVVSPSSMRKASPEFDAWFAGSKTVNKDGTPMRLYHGTSKDQDFTSFRIGKRGAWFTSNPHEASRYARENDSMGSEFSSIAGKYVPVNTASRVIPVHVALKNPYKMTEADLEAHQAAPNYARHQAQHFDQLRAMGHDGVDFGGGTFVAFHPHSIKSVFNPTPGPSAHLSKDEPKQPGGIAKLGPGKTMGTGSDPMPGKAQPRRDYSHLLPSVMRKNYRLYTQHSTGGVMGSLAVGAHLIDRKTGARAGMTTASSDGPGAPLYVGSARVEPEHQGKGFGKALYEALYAHAYHHLGARQVMGEEHSSMAHNVHQSLAAKHGLQYQARQQSKATGPYDDAYGPYEFALKNDVIKSVLTSETP